MYKKTTTALSYHTIDLIQFLKAHPNYIIENQVQKDCKGDQNDNLKLSQKRANTLQKFLAKQGIPHKQVVPIGIGLGTGQKKLDEVSGTSQVAET